MLRIAAVGLVSVACGRGSDQVVRADSLTAAAKPAVVAPTAAPADSPATSSGAADRYGLGGKPAWEVDLPKDLSEISGLAFTADGRLFAHGDQDAVIHQLDARSGKVLKTFRVASSGKDDPDLGKKHKSKVLAGDFEDIQVVGDRFFLISSNGILIEFREGKDGGDVPYQAHDTGLGKVCEIEGLAKDPAGAALLILCKIPHKSEYRNQVVVFAWPLDGGTADASPRIRIDYARLRATGAAEFHGSALAVTPGGRSLLLVAGPQETWAEISLTGDVLAAGSLDRDAHRQPEGLAFAPDGTLLVSDEGAGKRATLSGYRAGSGT